MPSLNYLWNYGVALSGLTFSLFTNSGTVAIYPNTANLSSVISLNGSQAVAALGAVISGVASSRFYSIATISAANMACYTWCVLVTSNSGCQPTTIHGCNISGPFAYAVDCSGNDNILRNVSGIPGIAANLSGYSTSSWQHIVDIDLEADYIRTTISGMVMGSTPTYSILSPVTHTNALVGLWGSSHTSSLIARVTDLTNAGAPATIDISSIASQVWNSLADTYTSSTTMGGKSVTVDTSAVAGQVWNSLTNTFTSSPTFGGAVMVSGKLATVSGIDSIIVATSGIPGLNSLSNIFSAINGRTVTIQSHTSSILLNTSNMAVEISGMAKRSDVSSLGGVLVAVSSIPVASASSVAGIQTTDATVLASGTFANDVRMVRHFTWNDMTIDKRYTPVRQYHWNGTNNSSYFEISDDSDTTKRTRGV